MLEPLFNEKIHKLNNNKMDQSILQLKINDDLFDKLAGLVRPYKLLVKSALVYNISEHTAVLSDRRHSLKRDFNDADLHKLLNEELIPTIQTKLSQTCPGTSYDVSIGDQEFDYVRYENGGYFDLHHDFVRMSNPNHCQYTMLIGLTPTEHIGNCSGGETIVYVPVTSANQTDFDILSDIVKLTKDKEDPYDFDVFQQIALAHGVTESYVYNLHINHYSKTIRLTDADGQIIGLPHLIKTYFSGDALLFKSELYHSGEIFRTSENDIAKECLMITINVTKSRNAIINTDESTLLQNWLDNESESCITFDQFDDWMIDFSSQRGLIPFQIVTTFGEIDGVPFNQKTVTHFNFDSSCNDNLLDQLDQPDVSILERITEILNQSYNSIKEKYVKDQNSKAWRKIKILSSHIKKQNKDKHFDEVKNININRFAFKYFEITADEYRNICDKIDYYAKTHSDTSVQLLEHKEKLQIRTETQEWCNDGPTTEVDQYVAYLACNIDIKFGFCKI